MRNIFCFLIILSVLIQDSSLWEWLNDEHCINTYNNVILENGVSKNLSTHDVLHIEPFSIFNLHTGFLIIFSNISFTTITQTFTAPFRVANYSATIQKKFDVIDRKDLFYNCIKAFYLYTEEVVIFEFEHVEKRRYKVRVPHSMDDVPYFNATDVKELKIFFYVDVTYPNSFILKIQIAPKRFNITNYEIRLQRTRNDVLDLEQIYNVPANKSENGVIDFVYPDVGIAGSYNFSVRPVGFFNITDVKTFFVPIVIHEKYIFLITGCILMGIISPVFLVVLYNYYIPKKTVAENKQPSKEIIIETEISDQNFYKNFDPHKYNFTGISNNIQHNDNDRDPDVTKMIRAVQKPLLF